MRDKLTVERRKQINKFKKEWKTSPIDFDYSDFKKRVTEHYEKDFQKFQDFWAEITRMVIQMTHPWILEWGHGDILSTLHKLCNDLVIENEVYGDIKSCERLFLKCHVQG